MASCDNVEERLREAETALEAIGKKPHPHQVDGIRWMMEHEAQGNGALLADDPGCGKTYQALSLVATSAPATSTLVVVPTCIIEQWAEAARALLGQHAVYVHHGTRNRETFPMARLVITTYGVVRVEPTLASRQWNRIILDEIHEIKTRRSKISRAVMLLRAPFRWGLSGTPVQNTSEETANLFRFVLGLPSDTRDRIDVVSMIRSHLLRRRKEAVLKDKLPTLEIETVMVPFSNERERDFYLQVQRNVKREFSQLADMCLSASEENVVKFELLLRLRQASQHPQLVLNGFTRKYKRSFGKWLDKETGEPLASSKHLHLLEMIKTHPDESALVFCQFTEEMDILEQLLVDRGMPCLRLDGSMNATQRQEMLQQCSGENFTSTDTFQAGASGARLTRGLMGKVGEYLKPPTTLIQIKAGGVGLNLQAFSRVYINSPDWNPCNEIQAMARSHRLGQTRDVIVKRLAIQAPEGETVIDDRIMGVQESKRNLMADLLDEEELRSNGRRTTRKLGLTNQDFRRLLRT